MPLIPFIIGLGLALAALAVLVVAIKNRRPHRVLNPPDKIKEAKAEFERVFMERRPWSTWIVGCGISRLGLVGGLSNDEDPDEWCLVAYLEEPLPEGFTLPGFYHGVPVRSKITGEIIAFS